MADLHETFMTLQSSRSGHPLIERTGDPNIARTILAMFDHESLRSRFHSLRETSAYIKFLQVMLPHYEDLQNDPELNRDDANKLRVYFTYGTAHRDSLPAVFEQYGASVSVQTLETLDESIRLERNIEERKQNIQRKVAFGAFTTLLYANTTYSQQPDTQKTDALIYRNLERVNEDIEETTKFLIQCIQINEAFGKKDEADIARAFDWLMNVYRELTAETN